MRSMGAAIAGWEIAHNPVAQAEAQRKGAAGRAAARLEIVWEP